MGIKLAQDIINEVTEELNKKQNVELLHEEIRKEWKEE